MRLRAESGCGTVVAQASDSGLHGAGRASLGPGARNDSDPRALAQGCNAW